MELKQIDKGIISVRTMGANLNKLVQELGVAILVHASEHGDVTRAMKLTRALSQSSRQEYLVRWFAYFGGIGINLKDDKVKFIDKSSKNYRPIDLDGAKANKWNEPFDQAGNRSVWYTGPNPRAFVPNTLIEFGGNLSNFADRQMKALDDTKKIEGKDVPVYDLTEDQKIMARKGLNLIRRIAGALGDAGQLPALEAEVKELQARIESETKILDYGSTDEPELEGVAPPAAANG